MYFIILGTVDLFFKDLKIFTVIIYTLFSFLKTTPNYLLINFFGKKLVNFKSNYLSIDITPVLIAFISNT